MGDHFVLLVDRLLTESTLEAAIESRNRSKQTTPSVIDDMTVDYSSHKIDFGKGSSPGKLAECRICQDEDEDSNMETPCSCCGSLKYAHRTCVQRWCNEKGDTFCEICHQQFKPGYTAPPPLFQFGDIPMNFRGNWEISRRDLNNPRFIAVVSTNRNFLDPAYEEYSASTSRSLMCCRSVALISKLAAILASFIIHKPRQKSSFTKAALKTLESIGALEQFMLKHRKDYVDVHRTTEQERDSIEHEVGAFIKACKEQIDILKNSINDEAANSKGWLGNRGDTNADTVAHKHGVVLILSERLHSVTSHFDQLRAMRFQEAINRAIPRRKLNRAVRSNSTDISKSNNSELREPDELQLDLPEPLRVQQQLLDDETRALQVELTSLLDAVQETETKMVEMSALNHLMSTHVLQQAQQIELLYEQAVEATKNVELGNKELSQAIQRNSSSRTFLLLFLFVLTFSILFLDWYN